MSTGTSFIQMAKGLFSVEHVERMFGSQQNAVIALLGAVSVYYVGSYAQRRRKMQRVNQKAIEVLMERNRNTYNFKVREGLDVEAILKLDIEGLQKGLRDGKLTSVDLVHIFGLRCQTIGRNLCLSAEENFHQAMELAIQKDKERNEAKQKGPEALEALGQMHGIPFSVKDLINMKGKLSTIGCAFLCADEFRAADDAAVVKLYIRAGAIPLVRGSVPQSALSLHTNNLIWGEARYPLNQERSCGGSSGGEAGLVAARCIPTGLGTDVGGSVRFPAAFCGVCGLKPSTFRVSRRGIPPARRIRFQPPGHLRAVVGPLGISVQDLAISAKVLFASDMQYFDPLEPPVPFKQEDMDYVMNPANFKKVKIGVLEEFSSHLGVSDSVKRAMRMAKEALTKIGYDVVPFKFNQQVYEDARKALMGMIAQTMSAGMAKDFYIECETMLKPLESNVMIMTAGMVKRKFIDLVMIHVMDNARGFKQLNELRRRSPEDFEEFLGFRYEFVNEMAEIFKSNNLTSIVMPIWPHCGIKCKNNGEMGVMLDYSIMWNVTGFPAGVLPITRVQENEQSFTDSYNDRWTRTIDDDCKNSKGMPISVQVVAFNFRDEHVLGIMKMLEKEIGYQIDCNPKVDMSYGEKLLDPVHGYTLNRR